MWCKVLVITVLAFLAVDTALILVAFLLHLLEKFFDRRSR